MVIIVDYILSSSYSTLGDINIDGQLGVVDIVQLVSLIIVS